MKQTTADSDFTNYLYFSTVTFTTLGYGDFRPCESARLLAAVESLLGGFIMPFSSAALFLSKFLKDNSPAPATQAKRHLVETVDDDFVC
jgi:voltage-gated potassium channel Kch